MISQETIARKTTAKKGPAKPSGGVTKRKRPSNGNPEGKKKKPARAGKTVPAGKKLLSRKKKYTDMKASAPEASGSSGSSGSSGTSGKKKRRRRLPGEAATMKMVALQMRTAKQKQEVENEAKFNRGVYTCARNINPEMRVGKDGASLIYQEGNDFISDIVSKAMCITLASGEGKKGASSRRLEAKHILATLSSNPEYLAKITPHPPIVSVVSS